MCFWDLLLAIWGLSPGLAEPFGGDSVVGQEGKAVMFQLFESSKLCRGVGGRGDRKSLGQGGGRWTAAGPAPGGCLFH